MGLFAKEGGAFDQNRCRENGIPGSCSKGWSLVRSGLEVRLGDGEAKQRGNEIFDLGVGGIYRELEPVLEVPPLF